MIKVILFDLGGTVLTDSWNSEIRKKVSRKFKFDLSEIELLHKKHIYEFKTGKISENDFLKKILQNQDRKKIKQVKEYLRKLNKIDKRMIMLIKKLKKNYRLIVLNNEPYEWNEFRKKRFELKKYFEGFFSSCDLHMAKPEKRIYKHVLKKLKSKPEEVLFIDDKERNLIPAKELGIKIVHFKNPKQLKDDLIKCGIYGF